MAAGQISLNSKLKLPKSEIERLHSSQLSEPQGEDQFRVQHQGVDAGDSREAGAGKSVSRS